MKRILWMVAVCMAAAMTLAAERSESELKSIAKRQLGLSARRLSAAAMNRVSSGSLQLVRTFEDGGLVVYADQQAGSVIMSKDDRFPAVLGYTAGVIDGKTPLPCCMKWWIGEMNRQMEVAAWQGEAADVDMQTDDVPAVSHSVVAPMVTTKWAQDSPYNFHCPVIDDETTVTGCGATALAQICNFNEFPKSALFVATYYIQSGGTKTAHTANVSGTYKYPLKKAYGYYSVDGSTTNIEKMSYVQAEQKYIGALCRDCGYALNMVYGVEASGSSPFDTPVAATECLGYPKESIKQYWREFYTQNEWQTLVYGELAKGYPILYSGQDKTAGGHAFVVDGIDADGLVSVNWGWQGLYDGYYAMDLMAGGGNEFSEYQSITIGFRPTALSNDRKESVFVSEGYALSNGEGTEQIVMDLSKGFYNYNYLPFNGALYLCVEDAGSGDITVLKMTDVTDLDQLYGYSMSKQCIDEDLQEVVQNGHTYKLYCASATSDELDRGELQKFRVPGGAIYFTMTVDNTGKMRITGNTIDDIITAIDGVKAQGKTPADGRTYNLDGMRVGSGFRGIVIKDGKKYLAP
ncbi:MAG: C10 family peptidase [Prevotella sp.]